MSKPIRYRIIQAGDSDKLGTQVGDPFSNLKKAIAYGKEYSENHNWFIWDDWNQCAIYNSWTGREEPHINWQTATGKADGD